MKSHGRNQSSANFSRLCLKSNKSNTRSSHNSTAKPEKISKCLTSATKSEGNTSTDDVITSDNKYKVQNFEESLPSTSIQSPYKNFLTEVCSVNINTSGNEEKDFKTPNRVFKTKLEKPKVNSKPTNNAKQRGRKPKLTKDSKSSTQMVLTRTLRKSWNETDVNVEHLELALALSRSLENNHKHESNENESHSSSVYPSTQQKLATVKETLEQFGLKSCSKKIDVQHKRIPIKRKNKKSRYQYITPVLLLRTEKDRERLISEKVTLILSQNLQDDVKDARYTYESKEHITPVSEKLKKNWSNDNRIFNLHNFELDTSKSNEKFYINSLNIPSTETKCGSLLKDWSKIPGRDKSPLRKCMNEVIVINSEDENQTIDVSDQCITKENTIMCSNTVNSDFTEDTLSKTLKNNLQIRSFSNRSISPELFESDEELPVEILRTNSPQIILADLNEDHNSESLLNLTPRKNKSVIGCIAVDLNLNKDVDISENFVSESFLSVTPTKVNKPLNTDFLENTYLDTNNVTSPFLLNSSESSFQAHSDKNKSTSPVLPNEDLFVNDNGICTFECFSNDNEACFDFTNSSDEENNGLNEKKYELNEERDASVFDLTQPSNDVQSLNVSFDKAGVNVNHTLQNISPIISSSSSIRTSLSTGISEIMQKSMHLHQEDMNSLDVKEIPEITRRSKSLNITEYICTMLNEEQLSIISNSEQGELELEGERNSNADANNVCDLTQSSSSSLSSNYSTCTPDQKNSNFSKKRSKETVSESGTDDNLSPVKTNSISRFDKHDSFKSTTSDDMNPSQESQESICISDEELNYSSVYGTPCMKTKQNSICEDNYVYEISDDTNVEDDDLKAANSVYDDMNFTPKTSKEASNNKPDLRDIQNSDNYEMGVDLPAATISFNDNQEILLHPRIKSLSREHTPTGLKSRKSLFDGANLLDDSFNTILEDSHLFGEVQQSTAGSSKTSNQVNLKNENSKTADINTTPKAEMLIKTTNVTPITNYNEMDTPTLSKELQKFGLKTLKRQRGVQILKHIYESTHPVIGQTVEDHENPESDDEDRRVIKRRKSGKKMKGTKKSQSPRERKSPKNIKFCNERENDETACGMKNVNVQFKSSEEKIEIVGDLMSENETLGNIIFERKHSRRVASCRVPLHIAWHNLVSAQPELRKNILLYEPLQLEVLYQLLKEQGYKYHIQDLLTFLDKKCITIRTKQTQCQNSRQRRKSVSPKKPK